MSFIIDFTNTSNDEGTVIPDGGFFYTDNLNSINRASFVFSGSSETKRSLIEIGSKVKVYRNGTLEFQGLVDDIEFYDGGAMNVQASGFEVWLAKENGDYSSSPYTSTASATIFSDVIGESSEFTAGTVEAGTSIDFRAIKSDSLWNVINNLRKKTAQDIGIDYPNLQIDILDHKGSSNSVETLNSGIQIGDVQITKSYPISNKVKVYGQSEGSTRIESDDAQGQNAGSQSTYGVINYIINDRTIITVTEANLLANAEVARLKEPRKIYNFTVLNPAKSWVSGDVLIINAPSQEVSSEEVRIVQLKRGVRQAVEFLELEVTNKEFSDLTKTRDEIVAEIDKKYRDSVSYDAFQAEYSNQTAATNIGGHPVTLDQIGGVSSVLFGCKLGINSSPGAGVAAIIVGGDLVIGGTGGEDINGQGNAKGINFVDPTDAQDLATKAYVDTAAGGGGNVCGTGTANRIAGWSATDTICATSIILGTGEIYPGASFSWGRSGDEWQGIWSTTGDFSGDITSGGDITTASGCLSGAQIGINASSACTFFVSGNGIYAGTLAITFADTTCTCASRLLKVPVGTNCF